MTAMGLLRRLAPAGARRAVRDALPVAVHQRLRLLTHGADQQRLLASLLPDDQWCVDHVDLSADGIEVRGWALPPKGNHAAACFGINGRAFTGVTYPLERKDIGRLFWYLPYAVASGFVCRLSIPRAFIQVPLRPPMPFEDGAFDLIIGVSVFTHLAADDERRWLNELRRVCRPGGVLLMSTHGAAAVCRAGLDPALLHRWTTTGFADQHSRALQAVLDDRAYYRDSFHSPDYIRREWGRYFEIADVIPAVIGNHQDLVVMRLAT